MECHGQWQKVKVEVEHLTASGQLGAAIFTNMMTLVSASGFAEDVSNLLKSKLASVEFFLDVGAIHTELLEIVAKYEDAGFLEVKRSIELTYMNFSLQVDVVDLHLEAMLRLGAFVRNQSLGQESGLQKLPFDEWLLPDLVSKGLCRIPLKHLETMNKARTMAANMLSSDSIQSLQDVQKLFQTSADAICAVDPTFRIEVAFLTSSLQVALATAIQERILRSFPDPIKDISVGMATKSLTDLKSSKIVALASRESQAQVDTVLEIVAKFNKGTPVPAHLFNSTDFYKQLASRFAYFIRVPVSSKTKTGETMESYKFGREAVLLQLHDIGSRVHKSISHVTLAELESMHRWKHLTQKSEIERMGDWIKKSLAASTASGAASSSAIAAVGPKSKKNKPKKKDVEVNVDAFFGD